MGASGAVVMGFFGAMFASTTLLIQFGWRGWALGLPFIGFAAIAAAVAMAARLPGAGFVRPARAGRVIMWSSLGEGVALFAVGQLCVGLGRVELILPLMALVVGLHFLPIARWAPFPPLYPLAGTMIAGALAGLALPRPAGGAVAGFTAAAALAAASIAALRRERAAKRQAVAA